MDRVPRRLRNRYTRWRSKGNARPGRIIRESLPVLAVNVALRVAPTSRRLAAAVPGFEALRPSPGLDQRAVAGETLVRQQRLDPRLAEHCSQELRRHIIG